MCIRSISTNGLKSSQGALQKTVASHLPNLWPKMISSVILCVCLIFTSCTSAHQTLGHCGRYCGKASEPNDKIARIIGGQEVQSPRPWAVLLLERGQPNRCGGFLINRRFVLTVKHLNGECHGDTLTLRLPSTIYLQAAHCYCRRNKQNKLKVGMKFPNAESQGTVYKVGKKYLFDLFIGVNNLILDEDDNFRKVILKRGN